MGGGVGDGTSAARVGLYVCGGRGGALVEEVQEGEETGPRRALGIGGRESSLGSSCGPGSSSVEIDDDPESSLGPRPSSSGSSCVPLPSPGSIAGPESSLAPSGPRPSSPGSSFAPLPSPGSIAGPESSLAPLGPRPSSPGSSFAPLLSLLGPMASCCHLVPPSPAPIACIRLRPPASRSQPPTLRNGCEVPRATRPKCPQERPVRLVRSHRFLKGGVAQGRPRRGASPLRADVEGGHPTERRGRAPSPSPE